MLINRAHILKLLLGGIPLLAAFSFPVQALAKLSGEADLGYISYDAQANGKKVLDARSFSQHYSLLYQKEGVMGDGRIGGYNVSLGYDWASFNTRIKNPSDSSADVNPSISDGHILYEGELIIDPAELPLRFRAFSHDMTRATPTSDSLPILSGSNYLIAPNMVTNLTGGTNIVSGATLLLGVKGNHTNGYNALFRHLPMVMLDYRDELHEDLKSQSPVNTRLRKLAFVSLNKVDNWFHYRTTRYDDYINKGSSFVEDQYQLGTIDHLLQRKWIDITNWLKISSDIQFTRHTNEGATVNSSEYEYNLFGIATRRTWEAKTFMNFDRQRDGQGLRFERNIPLYVSGIWGDNTDWNARFSSRDKKQKNLLGVETSDSDIVSSLRVNTFKREKFTLSQAVTVENTSQSNGKSLALEGHIETTSTRRFSDVVQLSASYDVKHYTSENDSSGNSTYLTQNLVGQVNYTPSQRFRVNLEENISAGSGNSAGASINSNVIANAGTGAATGIYQRGTNLNTYNRYITTAGASWTPIPRLDVSLMISEDILERPDTPTDYLTIVTNRVDYTFDRMRFSMTNRFSSRSANASDTYTYESSGDAQYTPNRTVSALLHYTYSRSGDSASNSTTLDLLQRLNYTLYQSGGTARKLADMYEEITFTQSTSTGTSVATAKKKLLLGARYYPLGRLFIGGTVGYSLVDPGSLKEMVYTGTMGLTYNKLQIALDYSYGRRAGGDDRIDKRFSANMKKLF